MKPIEPGRQDVNLLYHLHKDKFPDDFRQQVEIYLEHRTFYFDVYQPCAERMEKQLHKLMMQQYPDFKQATHPVQLNYIQDVNEICCFGLIYRMRGILREQAERINIKEKYPKLEQWRAFYCRPEKPFTVTDSDRNPYLHQSDEEWEREKEKQNKELLIFHEWTEKRKAAYYDIVQPLLFEYLPALQNLEGDFWVLYATDLRDHYEEWKDFCDHLETAIDYEMPPESLEWADEEFRKLRYELYKKDPRGREKKRNERIYGKALE